MPTERSDESNESRNVIEEINQNLTGEKKLVDERPDLSFNPDPLIEAESEAGPQSKTEPEPEPEPEPQPEISFEALVDLLDMVNIRICSAIRPGVPDDLVRFTGPEREMAVAAVNSVAPAILKELANSPFAPAFIFAASIVGRRYFVLTSIPAPDAKTDRNREESAK